MNELMNINYDSERPTVLGRDLHQALGINSNYTTWFKRMCEYGFAEGVDYEAMFQKWNTAQGNETTRTDHQLTIDMAKQLCMIQRTEIGRKFREYFIEIEEAWNSPEAVMARALSFANKQLDQIKQRNTVLEEQNAIQNQQIAELQPKASYYDLVLNCKDLVSVTTIAKDYGWSARKMNTFLHDLGVQYKQGSVWILYQKYAEMGYTSTKTHSHPGKDGDVHATVHTYWTQKGRLFIYSLLKENGILPMVERGEIA
ncbi:MAG: phage antirepressor KilAC domain-containing protein [Peptococcaceae bacterium]|nr:phage antirepressor KilAC domain-containing protein [Peptococcaceae bacterium]